MLSSDKVTIHSVEQLGRKNESGELIIYRIDKCAPEMIDAITLNSLIDDIENMIISTQEGSDLLKSKLLSIGYLCMPEYDKYSYKCFGKKIYAVQEGFPRLTRDDIVAEIVNCEYVISIPGIDAWKKG